MTFAIALICIFKPFSRYCFKRWWGLFLTVAQTFSGCSILVLTYHYDKPQTKENAMKNKDNNKTKLFNFTLSTLDNFDRALHVQYTFACTRRYSKLGPITKSKVHKNFQLSLCKMAKAFAHSTLLPIIGYLAMLYGLK